MSTWHGWEIWFDLWEFLKRKASTRGSSKADATAVLLFQSAKLCKLFWLCYWETCPKLPIWPQLMEGLSAGRIPPRRWRPLWDTDITTHTSKENDAHIFVVVRCCRPTPQGGGGSAGSRTLWRRCLVFNKIRTATLVFSPVYCVMSSIYLLFRPSNDIFS